MIGVVVEENQLNHELYTRIASTTKKQAFEDGPPLALIIGIPGFFETLHFVENRRYGTELDPDEVEVQVRAFGVNFRDLLVILGLYNAVTLGC